MITIKKTLCPDATYTVQYEDTTPIASGSIASGGSALIEVPNCVGASVGATLMKTGLVSSQRTGDDGDLQEGRATDFLTLESVNPFSNLFRFTDELGGQTFANDIVIDWSTFDGSTVLGYYRVLLPLAIWDDAIDNCLAHTVTGFASGWYCPNARQLFSIANFAETNALNYVPFSLISKSIWSSTSRPTQLSSVAMYLNTAGHQIVIRGKTTPSDVMPVRNFTVTGTTLS